MKKASTFFLRAAIFAVGAAVVAICLFALPATWRAVPQEYPDTTYVFYCILLAMYIAAIPFFVALLQALKLLDYIEKTKPFQGCQ